MYIRLYTCVFKIGIDKLLFIDFTIHTKLMSLPAWYPSILSLFFSLVMCKKCDHPFSTSYTSLCNKRTFHDEIFEFM